MNILEIEQIENEVEQFDRLLKASEAWGKGYEKDPETHAGLIKAEAAYQRALRKLFREAADKVDKSINWYVYYNLLQADVSVDVVVNDDFYSELDSAFFTISFNVLSTATYLGALSGENIYKKPLGIESTDSALQRLTTAQIAALVGKSVDKDGRIVDNPNAKYRISDKTRNDIVAAVKTSINLGEDRNGLIARLKSTVNSPKRAEVIAQTESVNAFANGLLSFGDQSGATGKEWEDVFATDICATYANEGPKPLGYKYDHVALTGPAAHPGCRCSIRLVYDNEYDPKK